MVEVLGHRSRPIKYKIKTSEKSVCMHTYTVNLGLVSNYMLHDVFQDELHEKLMD